MKQLVGVNVGGYTFNAAAKTVTLTGLSTLNLEQILLITNVTRDVIIYQFNDPTRGGTISGNVITLTFNTTTYADSDRLQIFIDYPVQTQPITGTVSVSNTVSVSGTVSVSNFPATQAVTQSTSPWVTNDPGLPDTLGQKTGAGSTSVVIASDQNVPVAQAGTWSVGRTWNLASGSDSVTTVPSGTQTISGTVTANQGTANTAANGWPVKITDGTNVLGTATQPVRVDPTGTTTQPVSGTVTANAGTNLNTSALALESGGNLASIKTDVDNLNLAQGSTTSGQKGNLALAAVTTAAPTYTTGQSNPLSLNTSGGLRVDGSGVTQPVSGTVAATQSGTWTVQPGNTANTTAWLVTGTGGTFPVTGSVTADTELPAAAALADATANPTITSVGNFNHVFNGTTWDRLRGGTAGISLGYINSNALSSGLASSDAVANGSATVPVANMSLVFNGTTWDRLRSGTATGSVLVNNPTAANLNATVVGSGTFTTKETRSSTPSQTSPSVTTASTSILASNANRLGATIYNEAGSTCLVKLGSTASATSYTISIAVGGYYEVPFNYTGAIDGIVATGTATLRVTELT